ncbi:helix-turn-helix domain-containing protein [Candidatus Poriferisodalis sp.]|uniref:helix-turn-helix domain-containing protein n=1 Tax=Candidatus Poriferisodalis sp. TaxID=3101277 RepID=UPI003B0125F3
MREDAEVLTADEAARLLRVSTKTVLSLAREGTLPGEKVSLRLLLGWGLLGSAGSGYECSAGFEVRVVGEAVGFAA